MPVLKIDIETQQGKFSNDVVEWPIHVIVRYLSHEAPADEVAAQLWARANLPKFFGGAALAELSMKERISDRAFKLSAKYSLERKKPINDDEEENTADDYEIEWDLAGEPVHITEALDVRMYPEEGPDHGKLIGVEKDGVKGADVEQNVETFSITAKFPRSYITAERRAIWRSLRGKTNNAEFFTFPEGEVRLSRVSFRLTGADAWLISVRFEFVVKENKEDIEINPDGPYGAVQIDELKGWELAHISYLPRIEGDFEVQRAAMAYVYKVFGDADFDLLDLDLS